MDEEKDENEDEIKRRVNERKRFRRYEYPNISTRMSSSFLLL